MTTELTSRLLSDPTALDRFYRSFGLDSTKFYSRRGQWSITEFFPDTPIKMLKEVFEALKLYDLVELLERVTKPRTLHPALSLKEIETLQDASNRPTKFYSKAEVLIIQNDENVVGNNAEKIGTFFKALNSQTKVTSLSIEPRKVLLDELYWLRRETQTGIKQGRSLDLSKGTHNFPNFFFRPLPTAKSRICVAHENELYSKIVLKLLATNYNLTEFKFTKILLHEFKNY